MPDDVIIRELKPEDVETVVEIAVAAWTPIYQTFRETLGDEVFEADRPNALEDKANQVRRACEPGSPAHVRVAESAGRVVGFVTFYANVQRGVGEIGNNAVHPDFQGRGIGGRMYAVVFEELKKLGMRLVKVHTGGDPAHVPARRAYEKAGFHLNLPSITYYRKL